MSETIKNIKLKDISNNILHPETSANLVKSTDGTYNLGTVENGAQVNVIESISVNGTPLPITNKNVDLTAVDTYELAKQTTAETGYNETYYLKKNTSDVAGVKLNLPSIGSKLSMSLDTTTQVLTVSLLDNADTTISTQTVDFPIESLVLSVSYVDTQEHPKSLEITLQSGSKVYVSVADLISGLVNETRKVGSNALNADVTVAMLNTDLKDYTTTLTNKTIDADDNTISDLTTTNFKTGVVVSSFNATPVDTSLPTEKLVKDNLDLKEDLSNKKTSISNTLTNNDYVSGLAIYTALSGKQDTLTAGNGIDITSNTVSVKKATTSEIGGIVASTSNGYINVNSSTGVAYLNNGIYYEEITNG